MAGENLNNTEFQLRLKRGTRADLEKQATANPGLQSEPVYTTDDKQLFVHDGTSFEPIQSLDMAVTHNDQVVTHEDKVVYLY